MHKTPSYGENILISNLKNTKMPNSKINLWVHLIWSTKHRAPVIESHIQNIIYDFIKKEFIKQGCHVSIINGKPDHIHCLIAMNAIKSISEIMKQIKGSSTYYINQNKLTKEKFSWQTGYSVYSVCPYHHSIIFNYIKNHTKRKIQ